MAVFLGAVVLNVSDIGGAAEFWSKALGYVPEPDHPAFLTPKNDRETTPSPGRERPDARYDE